MLIGKAREGWMHCDQKKITAVSQDVRQALAEQIRGFQ